MCREVCSEGTGAVLDLRQTADLSAPCMPLARRGWPSRPAFTAALQRCLRPSRPLYRRRSPRPAAPAPTTSQHQPASANTSQHLAPGCSSTPAPAAVALRLSLSCPPSSAPSSRLACHTTHARTLLYIAYTRRAPPRRCEVLALTSHPPSRRESSKSLALRAACARGAHSPVSLPQGLAATPTACPQPPPALIAPRRRPE